MRFSGLFPLLPAALALSACVPLGIYYKQGATTARADRDLLNCRVMAANKVPVRQVTRMIPGPIIPPRRVCDADGNCHVFPGRRLPPEFVTEDANEGLRKQVTAQCMGDQGYEYVRIPACPPEIANTVTLKRTTVMPRLTEGACAIRLQGGGWQIVNTE